MFEVYRQVFHKASKMVKQIKQTTIKDKKVVQQTFFDKDPSTKDGVIIYTEGENKEYHLSINKDTGKI